MEDPVAVPAAAAARVPAAAPSAAVAAHSLAPQQVPAAGAAAVPAAAAACRRQVFSVELRPGETTIVSWKKLLKESGHATSSPPVAEVAVGPVVAAQPGPPGAAHPAENDLDNPAQPNRFSAVTAKIERLYMGKHSSDEEDLDDVPDDDKYDTEDSFIDDAELDEYFEVDNLTTKHSGYFINKGELEHADPGTSTDVAPKKRRRKDSSGAHIENNMPGKSSARSAAHMEKKLASRNIGSYDEYYHENNRVVKNKTNTTGGAPKRKSTDLAMGVDTAARARISSKDASYSPSELKDLEKHKAAALQPTYFAHKSGISGTSEYAYSACKDKDASVQLDFQQKVAHTGDNRDPSSKIYRKEKQGMSEFSGAAVTGTVYSAQAMQPITARESAGTKPKGTRLERAIRDLEKSVAEYRSPAIDINEVDPNGQTSVKRRLPQEIKPKLAKVARLSANHGKNEEHELMERLMRILGHLVQRRTLKRNMKEMVELGISAKQEKNERFQLVKTEINEMIKARVAAKAEVNEQQDGSADDFQVVNDERRALKGKFVMDTALEDRICDLYDLYVEGMDEDKGPQSRKLYVELADLWPQGDMDNVGIKDAISRSKDRRRELFNQQKVRNEERMKRKRLAVATKQQDGHPGVMQSAQVSQPSVLKPVTTYPAVTDFGRSQGSKISERAREIVAGTIPDDSNRNAGDIKKKKRKSESDIVDTQANLLKVSSQHGIEEQKPPKHVDEANTSGLPTVLGLPTFDQQPS